MQYLKQYQFERLGGNLVLIGEVANSDHYEENKIIRLGLIKYIDFEKAIVETWNDEIFSLIEIMN